MWDDLLSELWDLQWLKEYIPLTEELSDAFYMETAGIIDRVITLFELLQMEAIHENKETVSDFTPAFIQKVSETYFPTTRTIINSLSEGNINNSDHWDDLYNRAEERQLVKDLNNDIAQRKAREFLTNNERKKDKFVVNEYRNRVIENIQCVFGDTYDMDAIIKAYEYIKKKYPSMLQECKETEINKSVVDILQHPDKMKKKGKGENVVDNYQLPRLDNLIL